MMWAEIIDICAGVEVRVKMGDPCLMHYLFHTTTERDAYLANMPKCCRLRAQVITREWSPTILADMIRIGGAKIVTENSPTQVDPLANSQTV